MDEIKKEVLKDYLTYIKQRLNMLKYFAGDYKVDEIKYYEEIQKRIYEWAKKHKVFYKYITDEINLQEAIEIIGVSERTFYRLIKKQKADFITYVENVENELEKQYSFIPFTNDFMED